MQTFVILRKEDAAFMSDVELITATFTSKTDCFQVIDNEVKQAKIKWLNTTDKLRKFEVIKTDDSLLLIVHANDDVDSNIVATITYKVVEL